VKVLLIEDDATTELILTKALKSDRYAVDVAVDGQMGLDMADACAYDLLLMDVGIPKIDGLELCKRLRERGDQTPILLLTAKDASTDRVIGLDAGADDYVVKPFHVPELLARIRALLRRVAMEHSPLLTWENLRLNSTTREIYYGESLLRLTPKEYGIVELLLHNPQRIFSRSVMLDKLWDIADAPGEETVTTHVKGLRQKLTAAGAPKDLIEAIYGLGYRLNPVFQASPSPPEQPVNPLVNELWIKFKGSFVEQINRLDETAKALAQQQLTPELHQQAKQDAHRLHGSFGSFGFAQGSVLAGEIEQLLQSELSPEAIQRLQTLVQSLHTLVQQEPNPPPAPLVQQRSLLVVDDDEVLTTLIQLNAPAWNFRVTVVAEPALAQAAIAQSSPDIILLDLSFPNADGDGLALMENLADCDIPIVIFSGRDSLKARVEVSRRGGCAYLQKPVSSDRLFQTLQQTLDQRSTAIQEGNILIVDDDPAILASLRLLLEPWGLGITTLDDPQKFWTVLTSAQPDLLVLDVEMPTYSGLELCQVVRNDAQWSELPILFLTAHTEPEMIHQAFEVGADDYIRKPIVAPEVVTRILSRLQRQRRGR
jgi:DNA-binding response OmpR family regulator